MAVVLVDELFYLQALNFYMCSIEHRKFILDQSVDLGIPVLIKGTALYSGVDRFEGEHGVEIEDAF